MLSHPARTCTILFARGAFGATLAFVATLAFFATLPACSSSSDDSEEAPRVYRFARYSDVNRNGIVDAGDSVTLLFTENVAVNNADGNDFRLPVVGDALGANATVAKGPADWEVTITLAAGASLKARQVFVKNNIDANSPSGIDVATAMSPNAIESAGKGIDALPSGPVDIIPGFVDSSQTPGTGENVSVALGDIDGDGDLDIVSGNTNGEGNQVWTNNGLGSFTNTGQSLGTNSTVSVALGDIDGDGDLDLVCGNYSATADQVFVNDGLGTFTFSQGLGNLSTGSVALGDVDDDGDLDIIAGSYNGADKLYINTNGNFANSGQILGNSDTLSVVVGDLDGDGDLDFVAGNFGQPNKAWINTNGNFAAKAQNMGNARTQNLALGDVDRDGDLDIIEGNYTAISTQPNRLWVNDGNANFTLSIQNLGYRLTSFVELADFDGDGDLDLIEANKGSANRIWINNSVGTFTNCVHSFTGSETMSVALGDVDGDGDLDLVEWNQGTPNIIYAGSLSAAWGDATFVDSAQALGVTDTHAVALGDLNGDGDLDMVAGNSGAGAGEPNTVFTNAGGTFTDSGQALGTTDTRAVALGDLNGDGDLDLVEANSGNGLGEPNVRWMNNGAGTFANAVTFGLADTQAIALGDVDGDGDLDAVCGNSGGGGGEANTVFTNTAGVLSDSGQALGTSDTRAVALGDVDGDGDLDLFCGNTAGQANTIYTNIAGTFINSGQTLGSGITQAIALGDVDADGDLDMVAGNSGANIVYLNSGTGILVTSGQTLGAGDTQSVDLVDVDGDGDLDIVAGNGTAQANSVWLNDGAGLFLDSLQALGANSTNAIAAADVNRDGDVDIVAGNDGPTPDTVYSNE